MDVNEEEVPPEEVAERVMSRSESQYHGCVREQTFIFSMFQDLVIQKTPICFCHLNYHQLSWRSWAPSRHTKR